MKKTFLLIGAVAAFTVVNAQDRTPQQGDFGVELNLNINQNLNLSADFNNNLVDLNQGGGTIGFNDFTQGLKMRYFFNENMALRAGLNFGTNKNTQRFAENADGTGGVAEVIRKTTDFLITPGVEYHLGDYDKVSPYVGIDLVIGIQNKSETRTNTDGNPGPLDPNVFVQDDEVTVTDGHLLFDDFNNDDIFSPETSTIGFRLVTGVDYFFTEKLFVGAEFGFGLNRIKEKDMEVTAFDDSANNTETLVELGDTNSTLGFQVNGGIRIGWFF